MTPEDRARISAEMFAQHQAAMHAITQAGSDKAAGWADAGREMALTLAGRMVRGVPDLAAVIHGAEPTSGEEAGEHVA
jgi:hypothetical protein